MKHIKISDLVLPYVQEAYGAFPPPEISDRIDGGFSLLTSLLGITQVNPLPPHYYCPICKRIEFCSDVEDGFDPPDCACPQCGAMMRGDGHEIILDDCEAFFAGWQRRYPLFSEWRVSEYGKALIGEYLSQHGPVVPFFPGRSRHGLIRERGAPQSSAILPWTWGASRPCPCPVSPLRTVFCSYGSPSPCRKRRCLSLTPGVLFIRLWLLPG